MAQQFDYPKTETQLREIQDKLYQHSKEARDAGDRPAFKGLLEIMSAEVTIITAIHNIKSNHGSETPGVDSKTMRNDYLHNPFSWVVNDIQSAFRHYEPQKIRRVYIDKPGKSEKRPLGIPTIRDRIVQEVVLNYQYLDYQSSSKDYLKNHIKDSLYGACYLLNNTRLILAYQGKKHKSSHPIDEEIFHSQLVDVFRHHSNHNIFLWR